MRLSPELGGGGRLGLYAELGGGGWTSLQDWGEEAGWDSDQHPPPGVTGYP